MPLTFGMGARVRNYKGKLKLLSSNFVPFLLMKGGGNMRKESFRNVIYKIIVPNRDIHQSSKMINVPSHGKCWEYIKE